MSVTFLNFSHTAVLKNINKPSQLLMKYSKSKSGQQYYFEGVEGILAKIEMICKFCKIGSFSHTQKKKNYCIKYYCIKCIFVVFFHSGGREGLEGM